MIAKGFKKKYFSLAAIAATVSMVQLNAVASSVVEIEKVVVSASKYEETVEETTEDIEVITSEEIEEKGLKSLKDLINYVNGTALTSNGGIGKSTSVYLRGLKNDKVLILIDGVRYNDPSNTNGASIEHLLLNNIERVEIIKGAQSGIWGADAASGVINIVTKEYIFSEKLILQVLNHMNPV
jgi:vitamin B12 transporter